MSSQRARASLSRSARKCACASVRLPCCGSRGGSRLDRLGGGRKEDGDVCCLLRAPYFVSICCEADASMGAPADLHCVACNFVD